MTDTVTQADVLAWSQDNPIATIQEGVAELDISERRLRSLLGVELWKHLASPNIHYVKPMFPDEEIYQQLREMAKKLGQNTITCDQYKRLQPEFHLPTILVLNTRWGTWEEVLTRAGLAPTGNASRSAKLRGYTDADLWSGLMNGILACEADRVVPTGRRVGAYLETKPDLPCISSIRNVLGAFSVLRYRAWHALNEDPEEMELLMLASTSPFFPKSVDIAA